MHRKIISVLCSVFTLVAHAASLPITPTEPANTCDLDYQIDAQWSQTPRRFHVTLNFKSDGKGEAQLRRQLGFNAINKSRNI